MGSGGSTQPPPDASRELQRRRDRLRCGSGKCACTRQAVHMHRLIAPQATLRGQHEYACQEWRSEARGCTYPDKTGCWARGCTEACGGRGTVEDPQRWTPSLPSSRSVRQAHTRAVAPQTRTCEPTASRHHRKGLSDGCSRRPPRSFEPQPWQGAHMLPFLFL